MAVVGRHFSAVTYRWIESDLESTFQFRKKVWERTCIICIIKTVIQLLSLTPDALVHFALSPDLCLYFAVSLNSAFICEHSRGAVT